MKQVGGLTGVRGERPLPGIRQFNNFQDGHIRRWSAVVVVGAHHSVSRDFFLTKNSRVRMYVGCTVKYSFGSFCGSSNLSPKLVIHGM